ncbi:N-acetyl sugar amidotransferase [Flaviaesturariibacter flavus]|uniref:N-acetyl sugar amidotransferase n=1 Tax=Flaviaesturariibacter flavus TaxID=2502780 RepID=UPI001A9E7740|nr:N-acetyl sugar amidotransferase [Flaviaesturariibacter flavus]
MYPENHPLNLVFDEEGICSGCRVHEEKDVLDWNERGEKLRTVLEQYRCKSGNNYDCIIPVSGARDSHFIVHTVKNVYGMNPLLVSYNKHYNTDLAYRNLANLRIKFDCDFMMLTVSPEKVKKITRATMRRFGSMYWHCIAGQTVYPVQMAVQLKIPLIVWGAHQGVDQVGMYSHLDEVEMSRKYRKEHDLMGYEAEDLVNVEYDNVRESDVFEFAYPDDKEIERVGVRGIYLNNYVRWDSKAQHEEMIRLYGYETAPQTRTFDTYNDVDCFNYSDVHDYIKYIKHGYGKVTDHVAREIRLRRMTREQGAELIKQYTTREPRNLGLFLDWLGVAENSFNYLINQFRNPAIWRRNDDWKWERKIDLLPPGEDAAAIDRARLELMPGADPNFVLTPNGRPGYNDDHYILIGKGHYRKATI